MTTTPTNLTRRVNARLGAYTAMAGAALAATATTPTADANVVYSGPLILVVPNNIDGIYLDLVTGASSTAGFAGYDVNPFGGGSGLGFLPGTGSSFVAPTTAGPASALTLGSFIGATDVFTTSLAGTNFKVTGTEFLGLRFTNTITGAVNYGWLQFTTTGTTGFPATIIGYAYENAGASILAGQGLPVPEPATVMLLGVMAAGAMGVRQWRRQAA